jgi:hypothetical protein
VGYQGYWASLEGNCEDSEIEEEMGEGWRQRHFALWILPRAWFGLCLLYRKMYKRYSEILREQVVTTSPTSLQPEGG